MKKLMVLMSVVMFMVVASAAMADEKGEMKAGRLFLFQKCDETLAGSTDHDSSGCPNIGTGPWPIFPDKGRWGKLDYSLWGDTFKFSFSGRGLPPEANYTLIYYPDKWPGNGLICLGSGQTTPAGEKGKGKGEGKEKITYNADKKVEIYRFMGMCLSIQVCQQIMTQTIIRLALPGQWVQKSGLCLLRMCNAQTALTC